MFTGIIESTGKIMSIVQEHQNLVLQIESPITTELKIDQSVAHNGICLTITHIEGAIHTVCAVKETIDKTTISHWKIGNIVNLERCMQLNGRLDGHIVQGHVDSTAVCAKRTDLEQNWLFTFEFSPSFSHLIIEKGSVSINGTSLTCFNVTRTTFDVTIIPYTFEHTSIAEVFEGTFVNIEFDVIGKYIARMKEVEA